MSKIFGLISPVRYQYFPIPEGEDLKVQEGVAKGLKILGILKGDHFVPEGISRNVRKYEEELWIKVVKNPAIIQRQLLGQVMGTIGHDLEITDVEIREGKVSHYTREMQIIRRSGTLQGYAESYVLDTEVGRTLHAMWAGGVHLYFSSRADGKFRSNEKFYDETTGQHIPIVDPDKYVFERFDVVSKPGFLQAQPNYERVAESLSGDQIQLFESMVTMPKDMVLYEDSQNEGDQPTSSSRYDDAIDFSVVNTGKPSDDKKKSKKEENLDLTKGEDMEWEKLYREMSEKFDKLNTAHTKLSEEHTTLRTLKEAQDGNLEETQQALQEAKSASQNTSKVLESYTPMGEAVELKKEVDGWRDLGESAEDVKAVIDASVAKLDESTKFFEEVGTPEQIRTTISEAQTKLEAWNQIADSPQEALQEIEEAASAFEKIEEDRTADAVIKAAEDYDLEEAAVIGLIESGVSPDKLVSVIESMGHKKVNEGSDSFNAPYMPGRGGRAGMDEDRNSRQSPSGHAAPQRLRERLNKLREEREDGIMGDMPQGGRGKFREEEDDKGGEEDEAPPKKKDADKDEGRGGRPRKKSLVESMVTGNSTLVASTNRDNRR